MGRGLFPDEMISSAYEIDYEAFYEKGYRGIIYDIDNTLVLPDAPADERAAALFERLHGIGFQAIVLSNNKGPRGYARAPVAYDQRAWPCFRLFETITH